MTSKLALLAPSPHKMQETSDRVSLFNGGNIVVCDGESTLLFAAQWLQAGLARNGLDRQICAAPTKNQGDIVLTIDAALCPRSQGYRLLIEPAGVFLVGADAAGVFYGVCTLCQLLDLYAIGGDCVALPGLVVRIGRISRTEA